MGWPLDDGQVPRARVGVVVGVLGGRVLPAVVDQVDLAGDPSAAQAGLLDKRDGPRVPGVGLTPSWRLPGQVIQMSQLAR
jgi:hypothetical protein